MIMKRFSPVIASACVVLGSAAHAQTVQPPPILAGNTWTYDDTNEVGANFRETRQEITVDRVTPDSLAVTTRTLGASAPAREQLTSPDWSRTRSVNGKQTVVNQPLNFPLRLGKSWTIDYTENNPNREHAMEHYRSPYRVIGWEDVTVPAGTFHALKIEAEGEWNATLAPAVMAGSVARVDRQGATTVMQSQRTLPGPVSGRTYKVFWYVPEVKRWVRSEEDYYSTSGTRTASYKEELTSYKVSG
jgi:hypothetical protein